MASNDTIVGWTPESGGRGTWSIIWPCLSTLFLALWVSYHPMAPGAAGKSALNSERWLYTGIAVVLPESILWGASSQLYESEHLKRELQKLGIRCTLVHAFYVCMGGYVVVVPAEKKAGDTGRRILEWKHVLWLSENHLLTWPDPQKSLDKPTAEADPEVQQSDHESKIINLHTDGPPKTPIHTPEDSNPPQNTQSTDASTAENHKITAEPANTDRTTNGDPASIVSVERPLPVQLLSTADIEERSTAGGVAKFIVILQSIWFVLNCIFRGAHRLPLSQLEVVTLTYLLCSVTAYALWWFKPYDIAISTDLNISLNDDQWKKLSEMLEQDEWSKSREPPWVFGHEHRSTRFSSKVVVILSLMCSGAIHFIAWNAYFPTTIEQTIWRIAAIMSVGVPVLLVCVYWLFSYQAHHTMDGLCYSIVAVIFLLLAAAKLYVGIESFAAFRSAPAALYDTWEPVNYFFTFF